MQEGQQAYIAPTTDNMLMFALVKNILIGIHKRLAKLFHEPFLYQSWLHREPKPTSLCSAATVCITTDCRTTNHCDARFLNNCYCCQRYSESMKSPSLVALPVDSDVTLKLADNHGKNMHDRGWPSIIWNYYLIAL